MRHFAALWTDLGLEVLEEALPMDGCARVLIGRPKS
jgi:hypothetical protein